MYSISSTERCVNDARAGDAQAWSFLYGQLYAKLYSLALRICGNAPEAKDALQNTFIIAYLKLGSLKDPSVFGNWIKKILLHHCYRILNNRNKINNSGSICPDDVLSENEVNRKLEFVDSQARLYSSLAKLPEVLHSTILLRYFSEFQSYDQIARILSVPVGTIRSRLNQAKEKLSENWKHHENTDGQIFRQNQEWNEFYSSTFSALHKHDSYKNRFLDHLQSDIEIVYSKQQKSSGRRLIDKEINEDRKFGSWFTPVNIHSSGSISVVEVKHFNSAEHPDHCPENSVFVLYRDKGKVNRMNFHHSS